MSGLAAKQKAGNKSAFITLAKLVLRHPELVFPTLPKASRLVNIIELLGKFIAWLISVTENAFSICRLAGRALEPEADLPDDIRPVSDEADEGPLIEGVHDSFERFKSHAAR